MDTIIITTINNQQQHTTSDILGSGAKRAIRASRIARSLTGGTTTSSSVSENPKIWKRKKDEED